MAEKLPAFLSHNDNKAVASATVITASSSDATYPSSNLKLLPITKVWRSATAALSAVTLLFDFGSAMTVNVVGLINANLTSAATLTIAAGTTSATSDFSATMSYVRLYDWVRWLTTSQSYRYWKFTITDAANSDNFLEVGYPVLGNATVLVTAFTQNWEQIDEYESLLTESEFGVRHAAELFNRNRFRFDFNNKPQSEMDTIRTVFTTAKMNITPLLFMTDTVTPLHDGAFGTFTGPFVRMRNLTDSVSLEFIEESRGKKIAA